MPGGDAALVMLLRRRPALATVAGVPWLNYLRVPAVVSGVLLLVWSPLILRLPTATYFDASGLSAQPFLPRWLAVTAVLFAISAVTLAVRVVTVRRSAVRCSAVRCSAVLDDAVLNDPSQRGAS